MPPETKRRTPLRVGIALEVDPDVVATPRAGDVEVVPGLIYRPGMDQLIVSMQGVVLSLGPGKRFAEALADTMTEAIARETEVAAPLTDDVVACESCNVAVRVVHLDGRAMLLDLKPDRNGVYLITGPGQARLLHPFETPTGPTYRAHLCGR